MRNRLWYELEQVKFQEIYAAKLIGHYNFLLNFFNMVIAMFSSIGILGWKFWDNIPLVACIIVFTISLLKLILPNIIPSEKQIGKYIKIASFYSDFLLKLEQIWFDFEEKRINEKELQDKFYELKKSELEIEKMINEIHKKPNRYIAKKAKKEKEIYFNNIFYNNFNTQNNE